RRIQRCWAASDRRVDSEPWLSYPRRSMTDLESLLREMVAAGASDLFLAEGRPPAWRVDGSVVVTLHPPTAREDLEALMNTVLRPTQRETFDKLGDVDVGRTLPELG